MPLFSADANCTFESSTCGYYQLKDDQLDWTRHKGSTITGNTGPTTDHTTGSGKISIYPSITCSLRNLTISVPCYYMPFVTCNYLIVTRFLCLHLVYVTTLSGFYTYILMYMTIWLARILRVH